MRNGTALNIFFGKQSSFWHILRKPSVKIISMNAEKYNLHLTDKSDSVSYMPMPYRKCNFTICQIWWFILKLIWVEAKGTPLLKQNKKLPVITNDKFT